MAKHRPDGLSGAEILEYYACPEPNTSACVNAAHMFLGTKSENTMDMVQKGRHGVGESNGRAKLTDEDVPVLRAQREHGATIQQLAARFGIGDNTVRGVLRRRTWKHVS